MNILAKLELDVKNQFELDIYDENMYRTLRILIEKILAVRNLVNTRADIDQVAHEYAVILWLRVCNGLSVTHWTRYIMLNVSSTLHNHYKATGNKFTGITITDPVDEDSFVTTMYGSANYNQYVRSFEIRDYLTTLYESIRDDVLAFSRTTNIVANRKLYLSVIANLLSERSAIGLSPDSDQYLELICRLVRLSTYEKSLEILNNRAHESLSMILKCETMEDHFDDQNTG